MQLLTDSPQLCHVLLGGGVTAPPRPLADFSTPSIFCKLNLEHKNGVMTKCLEKSQCVQNHWVAPRLTQPFILPRSIK